MKMIIGVIRKDIVTKTKAGKFNYHLKWSRNEKIRGGEDHHLCCDAFQNDFVMNFKNYEVLRGEQF